MGIDYGNHQIHVGEPAHIARDAVVAAIRRHLLSEGYTEWPDIEDDTRNFAIGSSGNWISVLDSSSTTDELDHDSFERLSCELSKLWPVVDVIMSDSAAVHYYLYHQGKCADRFGNLAFPFFLFSSPEEAEKYSGNLRIWQEILGDRYDFKTLRGIWTQQRRKIDSAPFPVFKITSETKQIFGWSPLAYVGFTVDFDGCPEPYHEHLSELDVELDGIDEIYFQRPPRS